MLPTKRFMFFILLPVNVPKIVIKHINEARTTDPEKPAIKLNTNKKTIKTKVITLFETRSFRKTYEIVVNNNTTCIPDTASTCMIPKSLNCCWISSFKLILIPNKILLFFVSTWKKFVEHFFFLAVLFQNEYFYSILI